MMIPLPDRQNALRKYHRSNYGDCTRIITLCLNFLISFICLHSLYGISWECVIFYCFKYFGLVSIVK
jgi:hypothetical protein